MTEPNQRSSGEQRLWKGRPEHYRGSSGKNFSMKGSQTWVKSQKVQGRLFKDVSI